MSNLILQLTYKEMSHLKINQKRKIPKALRRQGFFWWRQQNSKRAWYVPTGVWLSLVIPNKTAVAQGVPGFMRNKISKTIGPVGYSFFIVLLEIC